MLATKLNKAIGSGKVATKSRVQNARSKVPSARPATASRTFFASPAASEEEKVTKQEAKKIAKSLAAEFHNSTRYSNSTHELLKVYGARNALPHKEPKGFSDHLAWKIVRMLRVGSDMYFKEELVYRAMMLETIAAVPGMVAGMVHHLRSLRKMNNDNWISVLLDEAQNERAHLFAWLEVLKPNWSQRALIIAIQGVFFTGFLAAYTIAPKTCHRFVGYLEEEAYKTYTHLLHQIDNGKVKNRPAPQLAIDYWGLPEGATMRDMTVVIREDEADHCRVNHTMANALLKLKRRDLAYEEINVDDSFYDELPGTTTGANGQVKAASTSHVKKSDLEL